MIFLRNKSEYQEILDQYEIPKTHVYDHILIESNAAIASQTRFSGAFSNLGLALIHKSQYKEARKMIDVAMALNENDSVAHFCDAYLNFIE